MQKSTIIAGVTVLASLLGGCGAGPNRYTQPGADAPDAETAVIRGYSRNFLFGADDMAFELTAVADDTLVAYIDEATVLPGRYCVQARRWTMAFRASDMTLSESACFDAEGGHTYLIRRRDDGFSVIDRRDPTVVAVAAKDTG